MSRRKSEFTSLSNSYGGTDNLSGRNSPSIAEAFEKVYASLDHLVAILSKSNSVSEVSSSLTSKTVDPSLEIKEYGEDKHIEIDIETRWKKIYASLDKISSILTKSSTANRLPLNPSPIAATPEQEINHQAEKKPIARRLFSTPVDSSTSLASSFCSSESSLQVSKSAIYEFLEKTLHLELSKHFLTDVIITNDSADNELIVVGRPSIEGTSRQHRHIIPFSFVTKLIESAVHKATSPKDLLSLLKGKIKIFIYNQKGFALKASDLLSPEYQEIAARMEKSNAADRSMTIASPDSPDSETVYLASPGKAGLFTTPTKKGKAATEYATYNLSYVDVALTKLSSAILDSNTATLATQALSRFIFILFNKSSYTCFADEGHSQNFEIRLYESEADAANPSRGSYIVVTPIELAYHLAQISDVNLSDISPKDLINTNHWRLDKCIRVVNCEGSKIKLIPDSLKILDKIVVNYNLYNEYNPIFLEEYNDKNLELKLLNYIGEPLIYNNGLVNNPGIQNNIAAQIAKLLYLAFDLKAPEKLAYHPIMDTGIVTYTSATGKRKVNYTFEDGNKVREFEKAKSSLDERFLRDDETDQEILALKLVEIFYIGTSPFAGFTTGFYASSTKLLEEALEHIITIAAIDYEMTAIQRDKFHDQVTSLFCQLQTNTSSSEDPGFVLDISVMGSHELHHADEILYH